MKARKGGREREREEGGRGDGSGKKGRSIQNVFTILLTYEGILDA